MATSPQTDADIGLVTDPALSTGDAGAANASDRRTQALERARALVRDANAERAAKARAKFAARKATADRLDAERKRQQPKRRILDPKRIICAYPPCKNYRVKRSKFCSECSLVKPSVREQLIADSL